jgi:hypothetical protein
VTIPGASKSKLMMNDSSSSNDSVLTSRGSLPVVLVKSKIPLAEGRIGLARATISLSSPMGAQVQLPSSKKGSKQATNSRIKLPGRPATIASSVVVPPPPSCVG